MNTNLSDINDYLDDIERVNVGVTLEELIAGVRRAAKRLDDERVQAVHDNITLKLEVARLRESGGVRFTGSNGMLRTYTQAELAQLLELSTHPAVHELVSRVLRPDLNAGHLPSRADAISAPVPREGVTNVR